MSFAHRRDRARECFPHVRLVGDGFGRSAVAYIGQRPVRIIGRTRRQTLWSRGQHRAVVNRCDKTVG